jgi:type IV pilus assembly protein PilE
MRAAAAFHTNRRRGIDVSRNRGFTLIELMIVVVIVAVLAAIAYPSYQEQIKKTRRSQAKADLMETTQGFERQFTMSRDYTTYTSDKWTFTTSPRDAAAGSQYYDLSLDGDATATSYKLKAVPANSQAGDRCGTLTIDSTGKKTHSAGDDDYCAWGVAP